MQHPSGTNTHWSININYLSKRSNFGNTHRCNIGECSKSTLFLHLNYRTTINNYRLQVSNIASFYICFPQRTRIFTLWVVSRGRGSHRYTVFGLSSSGNFVRGTDFYTSMPSSSQLSVFVSRRRRLRRRNSFHQTDARLTRRLAAVAGGR